MFYFPEGLHGQADALLGVVMLIVPALLMVSTIRFQSFKTFDLGMRRGYRGLFLVAAFIALLVAYPHEVLIVMAYAYFASGFIGRADRERRDAHEHRREAARCAGLKATLATSREPTTAPLPTDFAVERSGNSAAAIIVDARYRGPSRDRSPRSFR